MKCILSTVSRSLEVLKSRPTVSEASEATRTWMQVHSQAKACEPCYNWDWVWTPHLNVKKQGLVTNTFISESRLCFQMCVGFQIKASMVKQGLQLKYLL